MANPVFNQVTYAAQPVTQSGSVESNCHAIAFWNQGAAPVKILGGVLQQGQYFEPPGNQVGEFDVTFYYIEFDTSFSEDTRLSVIRKSVGNAV